MIYDIWLHRNDSVIAVSRFELPGCFPAHCRGLFRSHLVGLTRQQSHAEVSPSEIDQLFLSITGYNKMAEFIVPRATEAHIDFNTLMTCFDEVRGKKNASLVHYEDEIQNALAGLLGRSYRMQPEPEPAPGLPDIALLLGVPTPSCYNF